MPRVRFLNENLSLTVEDGVTILEAARTAGVNIETPCNAIGLCGKCRVKLGSASSTVDIDSQKSPLSKAESARTYVLACQSAIHGDVDVLVEDRSAENRSLRILSEGSSFSYEVKPFITKRFNGHVTEILGGGIPIGEEDGDTTEECYGVVVDIGTTTLVASLIDLKTGEEIATESMLNPQSAYAQDVLARINFASCPDGLATLRRCFIEAYLTMSKAMYEHAVIDPMRVYEVVFSGNTTMLHIACGLDPSPLGRYPYISKLGGGEHMNAEGLHISPFGRIYLPPVISAFVGADITSGTLVSRLDEIEGITAFIDVGTNGEIVLARDGVLSATSTAAGPAFEGMNIARGMRAARGALESFAIGADGEISCSVIGGGEPIGICGSGLLDVVGELVRVGVIGKNGRFAEGHHNESLKKALRSVDGKRAFFITDEVYITQRDIRQAQLAKGAVRAGVEALMSRLGVSDDSVDRVLIAGSFGYHLNERSLLEIGLLPSAFAGKVLFVGNTSQSGGTAFLLNTDFRERMKDVVGRIDKIELANEPGFEKLFVNSLGF
ncbi:MAG: ASKHA domain-containing protein [Synergistaceae bacterium]|jgi:uncharacterized 2Fe-2S/4Fe-4S cluster protein (DUF4445 family)|nr:ASKHA domain-containing protein [Synergistaceae bacterium]